MFHSAKCLVGVLLALSFFEKMHLTLEPGKNMQKIVKYLHVDALDDFSVFLQGLSVKHQNVFKTRFLCCLKKQNARSLEKYAEKSFSTSTWRYLTIFLRIFPELER